MSLLMALAYDRFMRASEEACLQDWRRDLLEDVSGEVLEIGAGTGANLMHYPAAPAVTRLVLTDDDPRMIAKLARRVSDAGRRAEVVRAPATALPFADATFDVVVSTLVLCSVPDPAQALAEVRRVLRPGGTFVFLEHVAAEDDHARLGWQRRIEPVWRRLAGNCHLTRRTADAIRAAGFTVEDEHRESMRKALPFVRPTVRGRARVAAT